AHGIDARLTEELFGGAVLEDEDRRPDEVCCEAAPENHDQHRQIGPEIEVASGDELCFGKVGNGLAGVKAEGEEGTHKASQNCDGDPLGEVVVTLTSFKFYFR